VEQVNVFKRESRDKLTIMFSDIKDWRRMLIWLLGGSRGGWMRFQIMLALREKPMNPNQLAKHLGVNYRTIIYHLEILEKHGLVTRANKGYGVPYFLSDYVEKNWEIVDSAVRAARGER
jgi:DNA-binding transcriptional ArsR family regulator